MAEELRSKVILDARQAIADAKSLDTSIDGIDDSLDRVQAEAKIFATEIARALNGTEKEFKQVKQEADGFLSSFKDKGKDLAAFAGIGGLFSLGALGLKEFFETSVEFQSGLAELSAITGVTGEGLDDLSGRARNLAKEFGGSATEQLTVFKGILSRLGPDIASVPPALSQMSENVNILSKATGDTAEQSMDALTTAMLQFKVSLDEPTKAAAEMTKQMNVMAAGAQVGAAEVPQVAEALKAAGVAASGAKLSFEETNAAIQVLAAGGKVGAEAGTALRNVIGLLQKQSSEGQAVLASMGVTVEELGETLTTQGLGAAVDLLGEGFDKLGSTSEKNAALMQLFGQDSATAAGLLLSGRDKMAEFTIGVTGTNAAFEQAATREETFEATLLRLQATFGDVALSLGGVVLPIIQQFAEILTGTIGFVTEHQTAILTLVAAYGAFRAVSAVKEAGGLAKTFADGAAAATKFGSELINKVLPGLIAKTAAEATGVATTTAGAAAAGANAVATGAQAGATGFATIAQRALNAAMAANPILLLVAGVGALIGAFALFGSSTKELGEATEDAGKALDEFNKVSQKSAEFDERAKSLDELARSYDELSAKTTLTTTEQAKLNAITEQLSKAVPESVDQYDALSGKFTLATEKVREFIEEQKKLNEEAKAESLESLQDQAAGLVESFHEAQGEVEALRAEKKLLSNEEIAAVRDHANGLAITLGLVDSSKEKVKETNKELGEQRGKLDAAREKLKEIVKSFTDAGLSAEEIGVKTGLTVEEVRKLGGVMKEAKDAIDSANVSTQALAKSAADLAGEYKAAADAASGMKNTNIDAATAVRLEIAKTRQEIKDGQISQEDGAKKINDLQTRYTALVKEARDGVKESKLIEDAHNQVRREAGDLIVKNNAKKVDEVSLLEALLKLEENSLKLKLLQASNHKLTFEDEKTLLNLQAANALKLKAELEEQLAKQKAGSKERLDIENKIVDVSIKREELLARIDAAEKKHLEDAKKANDAYLKEQTVKWKKAEEDRLNDFRNSLSIREKELAQSIDADLALLELRGATEEELLDRELALVQAVYAEKIRLAKENADDDTVLKLQEQQADDEVNIQKKKFDLMKKSALDFKKSVEDVLGSGFDALFAGVNQAIDPFLEKMEKGGGVAGAFGAAVVRSLIDIGEQALKNIAVSAISSVTTSALMAGTMAAIAAAAAPAAALVAVASFGGAGIPANAALLSAAGTAKGISIFDLGGVVSEPTLALLAADGKKEIVLPEERFDTLISKKLGELGGMDASSMERAMIAANRKSPRRTLISGGDIVESGNVATRRTVARR